MDDGHIRASTLTTSSTIPSVIGNSNGATVRDVDSGLSIAGECESERANGHVPGEFRNGKKRTRSPAGAGRCKDVRCQDGGGLMFEGHEDEKCKGVDANGNAIESETHLSKRAKKNARKNAKRESKSFPMNWATKHFSTLQTLSLDSPVASIYDVLDTWLSDVPKDIEERTSLRDIAEPFLCIKKCIYISMMLLALY